MKVSKIKKKEIICQFSATVHLILLFAITFDVMRNGLFVFKFLMDVAQNLIFITLYYIY